MEKRTGYSADTLFGLGKALSNLGVTDEQIRLISAEEHRPLLQRIIEALQRRVARKAARQRDDSKVDAQVHVYVPEEWSVVWHHAHGDNAWRGDGTLIWDVDAQGSDEGLWLDEMQFGHHGIVGHVLREHLRLYVGEKLLLNAVMLDYLLLEENHHYIPESWQEVTFWGTIYCDKNTGSARDDSDHEKKPELYVRCFHRKADGSPSWSYNSLDTHWYAGRPAGVFASCVIA